MKDRNNNYPELPVLIVDDDALSRQGSQMALRTNGLGNTVCCEGGREALDHLANQGADAVILDLTMPGMSGEELLLRLKKEYPDLPVIVQTGEAELETAVRCMQMGAFDYMVKPVSRERLVSGVRRALESRQLVRENERLRRSVLDAGIAGCPAPVFSDFEANEPGMKAIFRYVESIARSPEPVLITGETGVGKNLMAECIHKMSGREGTFVAVNVAGVDETVFSDTLFGHVRGAFTGAVSDRKGLIETAVNGTLFLDEIGDLPPVLQVKLLHLLQERRYLPVGSDVPRMTNARVVVATNRPIKDLMEDKTFRRDLFFRLRHHEIRIPPLRERSADLPGLVGRITAAQAEKLQRPVPQVGADVLGVLRAYGFPGNVRELEAILLEAVATGEDGRLSLKRIRELTGVAGVVDPAPEAGGTPSGPSVPDGARVSFGAALPSITETVDALIQEALVRAAGNQAAAARMLGITRQALNRRLRQPTAAA